MCTSTVALSWLMLMVWWKSIDPGGWKPVTVPHQFLPGSSDLASRRDTGYQAAATQGERVRRHVEQHLGQRPDPGRQAVAVRAQGLFDRRLGERTGRRGQQKLTAACTQMVEGETQRDTGGRIRQTPGRAARVPQGQALPYLQEQHACAPGPGWRWTLTAR